ncbi:hypothetical protein OSH01_01965 [Alcaligenes endophyticus]|uniref:CCA tRNA nucleotidyltransferase n=1 Tax=Alcaligenes endophyticus TaxID=1929088 RepID=A0ABT8EGA8_9BURK|nr:hypothetical protein [Alcaligenes endophyticus]MCX5590023.1 hypothetical protein [Alcaligenes endophyticus]MDN4120314.1 hypothetical protein [Alcaligenes endophyticus]
MTTTAQLSDQQQQALQQLLSVADRTDPLLDGLEVYIVGGAVRDALLNLAAGDRDWVVVGALPEDLAQRGFIPVGGDFPVFLHPRTKEEFALARTERKSGKGYKGFTFYTGVDVSLADDLKRRDLTVNALAYSLDGRLCDPLGGWADIQQRCLRHIGAAFSEDPVRLLRLARFAARFHDFSIAAETLALARDLVRLGEVDALVPERVWQEFAKGLLTAAPGRMLQVLQDTEALAHIAPSLLYTPALDSVLAWASKQNLPLSSRYALLCSQSPELDSIAKALCSPREAKDMARLLQLMLSSSAFSLGAGPEQYLELFEQCDALRRPDRFEQLLHAAQGLITLDEKTWMGRLEAIRQVDATAIVQKYKNQGQHIKAALRLARLQRLGSV